MKNAWTGFLMGIALAGVAGMGYGYADQNIKKGSYTLQEFNKDTRQNCRININRGFRTVGQQCYYGDVMTGFDGDYIYCASPRIQCY